MIFAWTGVEAEGCDEGVQKMLRRRCVDDLGNDHEKLIVVSECQMDSNLHWRQRVEDSSSSSSE